MIALARHFADMARQNLWANDRLHAACAALSEADRVAPRTGLPSPSVTCPSTTAPGERATFHRTGPSPTRREPSRTGSAPAPGKTVTSYSPGGTFSPKGGGLIEVYKRVRR